LLIPKWIPHRSAIAALGAATREKETKYLQILLADGPRGNEGRILALLRILLDDHSLGDWAVAKELLLLANVRVPEIVLLHIPMQRLAIAYELMRLLADGSLWAEGIETGREPPEYARISEALWVRAEPYLGGRRHPRIGKTLGIGKTLVDFTCSARRVENMIQPVQSNVVEIHPARRVEA
jgi:hypothetical protein